MPELNLAGVSGEIKVGHKSNECITRKSVTYINNVDQSGSELGVFEDAEEGVEEDVELVDGDYGDPLVCIIQKLLFAPKQTQFTQRHAIFKTKCTVHKKVCEMIVDSGSSENIVSKTLVKALNLTTMKHPNPYSVGWIKKGSKTRVTKMCKLPFSIGKHYADELVCDVLDMDACHLLLGIPWQFDNSVTQNGKENTYSFQWKSKKIVLLPGKLSPKTYDTTHPNHLSTLN